VAHPDSGDVQDGAGAAGGQAADLDSEISDARHARQNVTPG
jgi:hypothetical protein